MSVEETIRDRLGSLVESVDSDEVLKAIDARRARQPMRRWPLVMSAAAAALVVIAVVGVLLAGNTSTRQVTAGPDHSDVPKADERATTAPASDGVTFKVLWVGQSDLYELGSLNAATNQADYEVLWSRAQPSSGETAAAPAVDFRERVVVSITIADDACPPKLEKFNRDRPETNRVVIEAVFVEPTGGCREPLVARTFVVAIDWASTAPHLQLRLPGNPTYGYSEKVLDVVKPSAGAGTDERLTGTLVLPASTVRSGEALSGEVVVQNNTGAPIQVPGCGSPYGVKLHNATYSEEPIYPMCLTTFTLPVGESRWPVTIQATYPTCTSSVPPVGDRACNPDGSIPGLPLGTYHVTVDPAVGAPGAPDRILEVTPAK